MPTALLTKNKKRDFLHALQKKLSHFVEWSYFISFLAKIEDDFPQTPLYFDYYYVA